MANTLEDLTNLTNKRMNVALLSIAMIFTSFSSLISGLFVVNRRCWVVPCAHRHRGDHGELLGLKVRSGDSFSALVTNIAAVGFAWWVFQMFFLGSAATAITTTKFTYLRGFSAALAVQLFISSMLWLEESGTVATFVHRGQSHINSPGMSATIPNVPLLHAMRSLALFTTLTFILEACIAYFLYKYRHELVPNNEYQSIASSSSSSSFSSSSSSFSATHEENTNGSASKSKHGKKKRKKKKQKAGSDFDVESNNNVFDDLTSEDL
jgi:hypothetical protein